MSVNMNPYNSHVFNTLPFNAGIRVVSSASIEDTSDIVYSTYKYICPSYSSIPFSNTLDAKGIRGKASSSDISSKTQVQIFVRSPLYISSTIQNPSTTSVCTQKKLCTDIKAINSISSTNSSNIKKSFYTSSILGDTEFVTYFARSIVAPSFIVSSSTSELTSSSIIKKLCYSTIDSKTTNDYTASVNRYISTSIKDNSVFTSKLNKCIYRDAFINGDTESVAYVSRATVAPAYILNTTNSNLTTTASVNKGFKSSISNTTDTKYKVNTKKYNNSIINNISNINSSINIRYYKNINITGDTESVAYASRALVSPAYIINTINSSIDTFSTKVHNAVSNVDVSSTNIRTPSVIKHNVSSTSTSTSTGSCSSINRICRYIYIPGDTETVVYHPYQAAYLSFDKIEGYSTTTARGYIDVPVGVSIINKSNSNVDLIKRTYATSTSVSNTLSKVLCNKLLHRTLDIITGKAFIIMGATRNIFFGITPVNKVSNTTGSVNCVYSRSCHIEQPVDIVYKANRLCFVDKIKDILINISVIGDHVLLYKDGYLKMDLCKHRPINDEVYLTSGDTSLFFL